MEASRTTFGSAGRLVLAAVWLAAPAARAEFVRGDANGDRIVDLSDAVFTLNFLFVAGPTPPCLAAADSNDDEALDISDPRFTLNFLFLGFAPPPPPFPSAGGDPTPGLGCGLEAPRGLSCRRVGPAADLGWANPGGYDQVLVERDGKLVATLDGEATSFLDRPPRGGDHRWSVRGAAGAERSAAAACSLLGMPDNRAPTVTILSPARGAVLTADTVTVEGRVSDERAVTRIVVNGRDVTPAPTVLPHVFQATVSLPAGPSLIRCEVVDDFGRTAWAEVPVGREPILGTGAPCRGLALDLTGGTGYDEIQTIVRPFLDRAPAMIDAGVRGVVLYEGSILGAGVRAVGNRAEVEGPILLDLFPSAAGGGRIGMRVDLQRVRLITDGRTDFGWLGTDSWVGTYTADGVTLTGTFALAPNADRSGLDVASDGFTAAIASSSLQVSGFLDPLGIFDGVVNFLVGLFESQIRAEVEQAIAGIADEQLLPAIEQAFSDLDLGMELGSVRLDTLYDDAIESDRGLTIHFGASWLGLAADPSFPAYPGSVAGFAPPPTFPLSGSPGHPVDATICFSEDTLNQLLLSLAAGGLIRSELPIEGIPLDVGALAGALDPRMLGIPGVSEDDPLGIRVEAGGGPTVALGVGLVGRALLGAGSTWRYFKGTRAPPAGWAAYSFNDAGWSEGTAGFGYSSDPAELFPIGTRLEDMPEAGYGSVYLRSSFQVASPAAVGGLLLRVLHDDGFVAYLNGQEVGRANVPGDPGTPPAHDAAAPSAIEPTWAEIDLTPFRALLRTGRNVLAIQGHNASTQSSDFVLFPELVLASPRPAGALGSAPAQIEVGDLLVTVVADTAADGVGDGDGDGRPDEVDLFAFRLRFALQTAWSLVRDGTGALVLSAALETEDGADPDSFPDAIVGGAGGIRIDVAREAVDIDDGALLELAGLLIALMGPSLGDALAGFELPSVPVPELEFDLDEDGAPDVRLDIANATLATPDTDGGRPDWICIVGNLTATAP